MRRFVSFCLTFLLLTAPALAFETRAQSAFILDQTTGTALLAKNADTPLPPASMSKLMTLYIAFEALRDKRLHMEEELSVSQHAMNYGGSTMFLDTTDRVKVRDLLRGVIVLSGNDACAVIAEALSPDGSERGFARYMTQRAQQLGLTNSMFVNSNGWPAQGQRMSMRDLALLAQHIISDFPEYYTMFAETEFPFDGRAPQNTRNRNPLLRLGIGADGLKTGHTQEAGYGLVGSARQGDRRIIFVISGLETERARAEEAEAIINWAFRQLAEKTVIEADTVVARAKVWMGETNEVALITQAPVNVLVPVTSVNPIKAEAVFYAPVQAPITKGQQLGEIVITPDGLPEHRVALVAATDVGRGGFFRRVVGVGKILLNRWQTSPDSAT